MKYKILAIIIHPLYNIKKYCYCNFFHDKYKCYPETWDRGLKGPWHCSECHPCGEGMDKIFEIAKKMEKKKKADCNICKNKGCDCLMNPDGTCNDFKKVIWKKRKNEI